MESEKNVTHEVKGTKVIIVKQKNKKKKTGLASR